MNERLKLPVFETLTLTLRWTKYVLLRHWGLALVLACLNVAFIAGMSWVVLLAPQGKPPLGPIFILFGGSLLLLALSYAVFIVVVHHEVLVGPAGFNRSTLGSWGGRVLGYIFDIITIYFILLIAMAFLGAVLVGVSAVAASVLPPKSILSFFVSSFLVVVAFFFFCLMISRLMLRLPSRAIGQTAPWSDVLYMGKGNSWRLFWGPFLIALVPAAAFFLIEVPLGLSPPFVVSFPDQAGDLREFIQSWIGQGMLHHQNMTQWGPVEIVVSVVLTVVWFAVTIFQIIAIPVFLSLAYARLYDNLALDPWRAGAEDSISRN